MKVLTYQIKLLEPVLVTSLDGDPNSANAYDYLPGSVLRGAIIANYIRENNLKTEQFTADDTEIRQLFFNDGTRFLNGYYILSNKYRCLPSPQSWQREKSTEDEGEYEIFDFTVEPRDTEKDKNGNPIQWQVVGTSFCQFEANIDEDEDSDDDDYDPEPPKTKLIQPEKTIGIHTQRTRKYGRAMPESAFSSEPEPNENTGTVFRYEALQAGQCFKAAILCDQESDVESLIPLINGEAKLGGSRTGGYGRVRFENASEKTNWREVGGSLSENFNNRLTITLLSDALLRNSYGQYIVDAKTITQAVEAKLKESALNLKKLLDLSRTFIRSTYIGGFNRKWGLPLPQALAVKMGSVLVYNDISDDDFKKLQPMLENLEQAGIGERRAEGFGRLAINWNTVAKLKNNAVSESGSREETINNEVSKALAKRMVKRMLRKQLDTALAKKVHRFAEDIKSPSKSQLSRLRQIIHDELRKEYKQRDTDRLLEYFKDLENRKTTSKQFSQDRIDGKPLLEWFRKLVEGADLSQFDSQALKAPMIGKNIQAELTADMIYEYNLRLIDGVLARAAKLRSKEGES